MIARFSFIKIANLKVSKSIISTSAPKYLKALFKLSALILKNHKKNEQISHPLLSLGDAEVVFRCKHGEYLLEMSTI